MDVWFAAAPAVGVRAEGVPRDTPSPMTKSKGTWLVAYYQVPGTR